MNAVMEEFFKNIVLGIIPGPYDSVDDAINGICDGIVDAAEDLVVLGGSDMADVMVDLVDMAKYVNEMKEDNIKTYMYRVSDDDDDQDIKNSIELEDMNNEDMDNAEDEDD